MSRKELIEDTEEVREVIAQLQAKISAKEQEEDGFDIEEAVEEDIVGDTFEEVVAEVMTKDNIGDVLSQSKENRRQEKEIEKAEKRVKKVIRDPSTQQTSNERTKSQVLTKEKKQVEQHPSHSSQTKKKRRKSEDLIISMDGVSKSYIKGVPALNNVSIHINKGEFAFIVGDSGSGKSTLIKLLLHELTPSSGRIMVNGFQVDKLRRYKIPKLRRSMGVVFQDFRLLMDRNVYENVAFAQRIIQVPAREMKRNVPNMLATVGLAGKYKAIPAELSGGEQQRVALARALVNKPPILLADEPTGNLDPKNTMEIMNLLEQINKSGTTVIVVTHNEKIVNDMQKRVITIKKGIVVSDEEKGGYIDED